MSFETLLITGGLGLFVAHVIRESAGGKRSSTGVHRKNGRLLTQEKGTIVTVTIGVAATVIAMSLLPPLLGIIGTGGAMLLAFVLAYFVVKRENYNR